MGLRIPVTVGNAFSKSTTRICIFFLELFRYFCVQYTALAGHAMVKLCGSLILKKPFAICYVDTKRCTKLAFGFYRVYSVAPCMYMHQSSCVQEKGLVQSHPPKLRCSTPAPPDSYCTPLSSPFASYGRRGLWGCTLQVRLRRSGI